MKNQKHVAKIDSDKKPRKERESVAYFGNLQPWSEGPILNFHGHLKYLNRP